MRAGEAGAASPTGGVALLIEERIPSQSKFRRFELHPDGSLRFGGGQVAILHKTDWEGRPSEAELQAILDALRDSGLRGGPPACEPRLADGDETIFTTIEYAAPDLEQMYELEGRCPGLEALLAALEQAKTARFRRQMDALPEPGKQSIRVGG